MDVAEKISSALIARGHGSGGTNVVRDESRHREKKGGSQVAARARERERERYSM